MPLLGLGLPELLREFVEYRILVYGAVLVAMMLLRPEGLIPNRNRQLELHEADSEEEDERARDSVPLAQLGAEPSGNTRAADTADCDPAFAFGPKAIRGTRPPPLRMSAMLDSSKVIRSRPPD